MSSTSGWKLWATVTATLLICSACKEGSSRELAAEILDRAAIDSRYGAMATVIPGGSSRHFTVSGIAPERPLGPLRVTGTLSARDDNGKPVTATFALGGPITFDDVPPPSGGACTT